MEAKKESIKPINILVKEDMKKIIGGDDGDQVNHCGAANSDNPGSGYQGCVDVTDCPRVSTN